MPTRPTILREGLRRTGDYLARLPQPGEYRAT